MFAVQGDSGQTVSKHEGLEGHPLRYATNAAGMRKLHLTAATQMSELSKVVLIHVTVRNKWS